MTACSRKLSPRPLANHALTDLDYVKSLSTWLDTMPNAPFSTLLGPMVKKESEVTQASLVRMASVMRQFIVDGHSELVFLPSRMEAAAVHILSKGPKNTNIAAEAALLTTHLCLGSKVFRNFRREQEHGSSARRFPKTGHLRRKMSASEFHVVSSIVQMIKIQPQVLEPIGLCAADSSTMQAFKTPEKRIRSTSPASTIEYDDIGFPVFAIPSKYDVGLGDKPDGSVESVACNDDDQSDGLAKPVADLDAMSECGLVNSDAGIVEFDENGWPIFRVRKTRTIQSQRDDRSAPIVTPKQKERKKFALANRSVSKGSAPCPEVSGSAAQMPENHMPFIKVMTTTTSEKNARFEVTAFILIGDKKTRIHIMTLNSKTYGSEFACRCKQLEAFCRKDGCTKERALGFKASWTIE